MTAPDARFGSPNEITFDTFDPTDARRRGSLFGLGNGLLFVRAFPSDAPDDEADEFYAGTYRAGCYNRREVALDGGQLGHDSLVNLPNWVKLSYRIGGGPWRWIGDDRILDYRHTLNVHQGITERYARVEDPEGRRTALREHRLVSMVHPTLAALLLDITPENWDGPVEIRSAIDGRVRNINTDQSTMPAYRHLDTESGDGPADGIMRVRAVTRQSRIRIAVAARTTVPTPVSRRVETADGWAAEYLQLHAERGTPLTVEKIAAITTSRDPATADAGEAAMEILQSAEGFDALRAEHERAWRRLWGRLGIEADALELQRAIGFQAFHLLQTISPHSVQVDVGLPSRGWQEAYHGQIFWDEAFTFPFLNHRFPEIARGLLMHRYRRLPAARRAARASGYAGAMFPWRSAASGDEETPNWQYNPLSQHWMKDDTRLQRHIGSTIATNVWHYHQATGDDSFMAEYGAELMVDICRFWCSLAQHHGADDRFDIRGVVGPDEYHTAYPGADTPGIDNNAYTNVMAALVLRRTLIVLGRLPVPRRTELLAALQLDQAELDHWDHVSRRLRLCWHEDGVLSQFEGFERLLPFDAQAFSQDNPDGRVDWTLEAKGESVNAYRVAKQADVLMLFYVLQPEELAGFIRSMGYEMDIAGLRRTMDYYLDCTSHESSLSRLVCAGALAQLDPDRSWSFFAETMGIDLAAGKSASADEGLHLGAMAGALDVLQRHYLGLHVRDDALFIRPSPPASLGRVRMRLQHRSEFLMIEWTGTTLVVVADAANRAALAMIHDGERRMLAPGERVEVTPVGCLG